MRAAIEDFPMQIMGLRSVPLIVALLAVSVHASAQSTTGTFQGTVADSTGAPLPGVTITIVNAQTNLTRTTTTNGSGNYDAPLLPPGRYNVSSELAGFRRLEKSGLVLEVTQNARVDFTLELATVEESVMVTAQSPLVDTQDSSFRQVIDQTKVVGLPLNGRNFRELGLIVPGVQEMAQNSNVASRGGGMNIVGAQDYNNNFLVDGFDNNDPTTGEIQTFPSVESVQEFTILGASYGADVGFASGGVVSLVSKSGSAKVRGNVFEFLRDDAFDAKNYFATTKAPLNRNQFGGTFGGPAGIKNVFFFGSYERLRHRDGATLTGVVPTGAMKGGDFSALPAQLADPISRQPVQPDWRGDAEPAVSGGERRRRPQLHCQLGHPGRSPRRQLPRRLEQVGNERDVRALPELLGHEDRSEHGHIRQLVHHHRQAQLQRRLRMDARLQRPHGAGDAHR